MPDNCVMDMEYCDRRKKFRATMTELDGDVIYDGPWRTRSREAKRAALRQLADMLRRMLGAW